MCFSKVSACVCIIIMLAYKKPTHFDKTVYLNRNKHFCMYISYQPIYKHCVYVGSTLVKLMFAK